MRPFRVNSSWRISLVHACLVQVKGLRKPCWQKCFITHYTNHWYLKSTSTITGRIMSPMLWLNTPSFLNTCISFFFVIQLHATKPFTVLIFMGCQLINKYTAKYRVYPLICLMCIQSNWRKVILEIVICDLWMSLLSTAARKGKIGRVSSMWLYIDLSVLPKLVDLTRGDINWSRSFRRQENSFMVPYVSWDPFARTLPGGSHWCMPVWWFLKLSLWSLNVTLSTAAREGKIGRVSSMLL